MTEEGGSSGVIARRYRAFWAQKGLVFASVLSVAAFLASMGVQYYAISFATARASNPATDLILSNIPVFDVGWAYIYGMFVMVGFILFLGVMHPKRFPFGFFALALFFLTRSFFVTLTHLAPYPLPPDPDFGVTMTKVFFGGDLFFSGHTGAPFLMALIFWQEKQLRYVFIALSIFFAAVVLAGHLHYSIDVFAAYFITYGIFHASLHLFPRSRAWFLEDDPAEARVI